MNAASFILPALVLLATDASAAHADGSLSARIDAILERQKEEQHIPGLAFIAVRDGRIVYSRALGLRDVDRKLPVTLDTIFPIGSATKSFTSMAIALAADDGKLSLDDSPRRFLPWFHMADPEADAKVTLRDMLSHRTGLRAKADLAAEPGVLGAEEYVRAAVSAKPAAPFRSQFQYSNAMFVAAGEVVASADGMTWPDVIRERIFAPLGMSSSTPDLFQAAPSALRAKGYVYDPVAKSWIATPPTQSLKVLAPAGAVVSTANDMARWLAMLSDGGVHDGKRFVSKEMFEALTRPETPISPSLSYALGWVVYDWNGHKAVEHNGGSQGISALASFIPSRRTGFVFLANTSPNYMTTIGNAGRLLWPILLDEAPPAPEPEKPAPPPVQAPQAPRDLPSADALIARMIAAQGGAGVLERHVSLTIDARKSYENQGVTAAFTIKAMAPAMHDEEEEWEASGRHIAHLRIYFDGAGGGQETTFGQDAVNDAAANAQAARDFALHPLLDLRRLYKDAAVEGRTTEGGEDAYRLKLVPPEGDAVTLLVSARTALVLERDASGASETYSDYRAVDGEMIPFRTVIRDALGETSISVERAVFNAAIDKRAFEPGLSPSAP